MHILPAYPAWSDLRASMISESSLARNGSDSPSSASAVASPVDVYRAGEIERSFREFREWSVRLVERVTDLTGPVEEGAHVAADDVPLVRSVFGKWSPEILMALHSTTSIGFEALRRDLHGISPRILSLKLRGLEDHGMILREVVDARPPRVRYALTDRGWNVAWLTHPVFLYLRHLDPQLLFGAVPASSPQTSQALAAPPS